MIVNKVGIVMLSYNRADVVTKCLKSIASAKNETTLFELFLLDNASEVREYKIIKDLFYELMDSGKLRGELVRLDYNSGFPAGNNYGIKKFLSDQTITHICLLNSDVIVTDFWLDRLLKNEYDIVGPVTNACGNEQTIPFEIISTKEDLNYVEINKYARERFRLFSGLQVSTNFLGFFCVIGTKKLFQNIGGLDEQFGRGGYEDDDFCMRLLDFGYTLKIDRSVFIYHFGSASFSQIPSSKLLSHLDNNRKLFELKYNCKWTERDILPYEGFYQDVNYLFKNQANIDVVQNVFQSYYTNSKKLLQGLFTERNNETYARLSTRKLLKILLKRFKSKLI